MSYQIAIDTIHLRPTPRIAHTEFCDHDPLMEHVERISGECFRDAWQLDLLWGTNDGPFGFSKGRTTDMGHASFLADGSDQRDAKPSPFTSPEEVWAFDAVKEYQPPLEADLIRHYEAWHQTRKKQHPNQLVTGGYYKTLVSGAIDAFGWDNLLEAAAEPDKFEKVLDSFFRLTMHYVKAQAKTSIEVYINHDDMVWSSGPFMAPDFYRRVIFPRYAELWKVLRNAGKKVLYCSDANFGMFVDDIFAAGADGLIFEPMTPLEPIVAKYGQSKILVSSKVDCRTLTFGTPSAIQKEIDDTLKLAHRCPGFIFAVGNHIPANIPIENALFYFNYLQNHWHRK